MGRGIAVLFHDRGTWRGWVVSSTPRPHFTPREKTRYPLCRRLGGPQGRYGWAEKSRPHRDSIPDRPSRSQPLYRLSYPATTVFDCTRRKTRPSATLSTTVSTCSIIESNPVSTVRIQPLITSAVESRSWRLAT